MAITHSQIIQLARDLRKRMTPAEQQLWQTVRGRKFLGLKFLRQYPVIDKRVDDRIYFFIADFYCAEKNTIIELDGPVHNEQRSYDNYRDDVLEELGYRVLRMKNEELEDLPAALEKIKAFLLEE